MKEACIGGDQPFVADGEASKVPQPGKGPFHHPTIMRLYRHMRHSTL
jgi:hypothetical protein